MTAQDFIHPDDAAALKALKSIPALTTVMEKVFQYGYEEMAWAENVTTNIRLSETQMPEIYNRLPPICKKLGIPVPELYLQMSNIANAWTSGNDRVYIVITLGLIKRCKGEELDAVLAHECGHIVCQHVLYQTLANAIFTFGDSMSDSIAGAVGGVVMKPIRQALIAWSRASELSADRVACVITPALTLAKVLARISMVPAYIVEQMDFDAWAQQGKDFEDLKNGSAWNKIVRWMANSDADHPYNPVRVYQAMLWEQTETCKRMRECQSSLSLQSAAQSLTSHAEDITAKASSVMQGIFNDKKAQQAKDGIKDTVSQFTKDVNVNSVFSKFGFKK